MIATEKSVPNGWEVTPLRSVLEEVDVRVSDLSPKEQDGIEVLSLTKRFGLIPQAERFNKRVATENVDKYKVIRRDWIVYNPYVIWEGAVHSLKRDQPGIVSPVYPVWKVREPDGGFVDLLLRTPEVIDKYKSLSSGAVNRRRSISRTDFLGITVPLPPLPEQKKIAHILSAAQRAIEAQERIIQTTTELKKALMHKLFTEGLRNESQKQTEIGPIPESWEVVELGTLFEKQPQNGIYKHKRDYGSGTQILRIDDFSNDGDIVTRAENLVALARSEIETYGLQPGDIVINRVNSLSHLGKTALIGPINAEMVFESNMMRFSVDESQVRKDYVFKFLNSPLTKKQIIGTAKRAVAQSSINQGDVKSIVVPKPSLKEQGEIADALEATESKIAHAIDKAAVLRDLFRTLLHELMTAKTRIASTDILSQ